MASGCDHRRLRKGSTIRSKASWQVPWRHSCMVLLGQVCRNLQYRPWKTHLSARKRSRGGYAAQGVCTRMTSGTVKPFSAAASRSGLTMLLVDMS